MLRHVVLTRFRLLALAAAAAIGATVFVAAPAAADTSPPVPGTQETMAADALPTVQINGVVWAQAIVGNTVYVGGEFTTAQPAGARKRDAAWGFVGGHGDSLPTSGRASASGAPALFSDRANSPAQTAASEQTRL